MAIVNHFPAGGSGGAQVPSGFFPIVGKQETASSSLKVGCTASAMTAINIPTTSSTYTFAPVADFVGKWPTTNTYIYSSNYNFKVGKTYKLDHHSNSGQNTYYFVLKENDGSSDVTIANLYSYSNVWSNELIKLVN